MPYGDSTIYGDIKSTNTRSSYSSEHLHRMVELVAGMGADPHIRPSSNSLIVLLVYIYFNCDSLM
mgnify:CR=1 FL=1